MKYNMRLYIEKEHRDGRFSGAFILLKYQNIHISTNHKTVKTQATSCICFFYNVLGTNS